MKFINVVFIILGLSLPTSAHADESALSLGVEVGSSFPLCVGGGADLLIMNHLSIGAGYGYMPGAYSNFIGRVVEHFSGNELYETAVDDGFQQATAPRVSIDFKTSDHGWNVGVSGYYFSIHGQADVVSTIQQATGIDLSVVQSALASAGYDPILFLQGNLWMLEAHLGYTFGLTEHLGLQTNIGVAKIVSSNLTLSSNAPIVDAQAAVKSAYSYAQGQLNSTLESDGITPIVSLFLRYTF